MRIEDGDDKRLAAPLNRRISILRVGSWQLLSFLS